MPTVSNEIGLSIIIPWRDRPEIGLALTSVIACAARYFGDVTIVNYGGDAAMLSGALGARSSEVSVLTVTKQMYFNKSKANNLGAAYTKGRILFFCDCDIVVGPGALDDLMEKVAADRSVFGTVAAVTETERNARRAGNVTMFGYRLNIKLANGRLLEIVDNEEDSCDGTRQAPGLLVTHRDSFERIDGYNGRLEGWGWEDQDMIARLTLGAGLSRIQSGCVQHVSHDEESRVRHYPKFRDRWESRDRIFRQSLSNYDKTDFTGTFSTDFAEISSLCEIAVKSVPFSDHSMPMP